jgi:threonine synthase
MRYISTRGQAPPVSFKQAVMAGLAPDGGLYLPERVPDASGSLAQWQSLPFRPVFRQIGQRFAGDELSAGELETLTERAYAAFTHPEVTPVLRVGPLYLVELFHGPTLAFKDVALQFLGPLFELLLAESGRRMTVLGATSGDTGSAAIHALRGRKGIEVFILFPKGRVSPMQEYQMTTVPDANVHAIAVEGSFDDAQDIVKGLFNDRAFNERFRLGAVNSINWARVMAQIAYFFYGYFRVLEREPGMKLGDPVLVSVPTGNFGHLYAAMLARRMGLPVRRLVLSTNANNILHRFVSTGTYRRGTVVPTYSPSMDIQVASNFERYLHDLADGDADRVRGWMDALKKEGGFTIEPALRARVQRELASCSVDDGTTLATIREFESHHGYLLDPHTAVGVRGALDRREPGTPALAMATAHPAKFGAAIRAATGHDPPLPPALAGLDRLPRRVHTLPARVEPVQRYIAETLA